MGNDLGRDGQGLSVMMNWDLCENHTLALRGDYETRSLDTYAYVTDPDAHFVKTENKANEERYRISTDWLYRSAEKPFQLKARFSYERVENFNFVEQNSKNNFLAAFDFQVNLDQWFQKTSNNR